MTPANLRRAGRAALALALSGGLLIAAGCGGDNETGDVDNGKTKFVQLCSGCHTLAASGAKPAYVGPNLDDSFRADREAGIDDEQFAGVVKRWITEAQLPMPRDLVVGQDAQDVASYVAAVAATGPAATTSAVHPAETTPEVPNPARQAQAPPG